MLQNLKTDIIYHLTPSDFEMEFNLGGCCRMRLLTEKTTDKKGFLNSLAKAVARSRVIMVCGPLFAESGLINTVASAIGKSLCVADNARFGINSDDPINILEGSVPLVTKDGYFGGCIIESGPQAIVLLTENKTIRKSIMKTLIHPYVEQLSLLPEDMPISSTEDFSENTPEYITEVEPDPIEHTDELAQSVLESPEAEAEALKYIVDDPEIEEETEEIPLKEAEETEEHNIPFVFDDPLDDEEPEQTESEDDDTIFLTDIAEVTPEDLGGYNYTEEAEEFNMGLITETEEPASKGLNIGILALTLILLIVVALLCFLVFILPSTQGVSVSENINNIFDLSVRHLNIL